jgi:hypothetical protein
MFSSSLGALAMMYMAASMIAAALVLGNMSTSLNYASRFLARLFPSPQVEGEIVIFIVHLRNSVTIDWRISG